MHLKSGRGKKTKLILVYLTISFFIYLLSIFLLFLQKYLGLRRIFFSLVLGLGALVFEALFNLYWWFMSNGRLLFAYRVGCVPGCGSSYWNVLLWAAGINLVKVVEILAIGRCADFENFALIYVLSLIVLGGFALILRFILYKLKIQKDFIPLFYISAIFSFINALALTGWRLKYVMVALLLGITASIIELTVNWLAKSITGEYIWVYCYPYVKCRNSLLNHRIYKNSLRDCYSEGRITSLHNLIPFTSAGLLFVYLLSVVS